MTTVVQGTCAPEFENVRAEFERNFTERGEAGAALGGSTTGDDPRSLKLVEALYASPALTKRKG
ncbi:hypothetical protein [Streptomyces sp. NPDC050355]|uniref:hypothetical protein n=1 Tax=Streptomyces sp. NPDC050355 TaxID=3365609 RepID=UPI00379EA5E3